MAKTTKKRTSSTKQSITTPSLPPKELLHFYREMLKIRRFEEKAGQLYGMGLVQGFCHLYIGQEAVVVGMTAAANTELDTVITSYRDHGHILATGMDPKGVMAELTGRKAGYSKGKGGSMHMFSREKNFFGGHGIVGAQVPIGTGLGLAHKYQEDGGVCMTYYGDGAANQGQIYESFNMAALWKLPVVYIIENNRYGMGTSVSRASATQELYARGVGFGIPGETVDGMDVAAVKASGEKALAHARSGKGPYILGMQTYRYRGHSMSDPGKYRTREEVSKVRAERDPIDRISQQLIDENYASEGELKQIDIDIKAIISEAADFAQQSPEPDLADLHTDVLVET